MNNPIFFKKIITSKKECDPGLIQEEKKESHNTALLQLIKYKGSHSSMNNNHQGNNNYQENIKTKNIETLNAHKNTKLNDENVYTQQESRLVNIENVFSQQYYKLTNIETVILQHNLRLGNIENMLASQPTNKNNNTSQPNTVDNDSSPIASENNDILDITSENNDKLDITSENNETSPITSENNDTLPITSENNETSPITSENNEPAPIVNNISAPIVNNISAPTPIVNNVPAPTPIVNNDTTHILIINEIETKLNEQKNKIFEISNNSIVLNDKLKNIESNFAYIRNLNFDIFTKLKKSCSQICTVIDDVYYVGFGWFYYDNTFDLKNGFFITAAHCVMEIKNNMYCKASVVYIMNPIDNNWILINVNNIFIDGIGDIALIKTGINLKEHADYCLKLANADPMTGDMCYIVGNATGTDDDLISMGSVRNPNYCDTSGFQTTSSIHVTCIGLGGNTGGPMVNLNGDVIGIYTFGLGGDIENFGGGLNRSGLSKSLEILKTQQDNKQKRYLGLDWIVPGPFLIKDYYELNQQFKSCIYIQTVCSKSPFFGVLDSGDLLLNATLPSGDIVEFGNSSNQRSPGILIYNYELITIQISYIKKNQKIIQTETINLNVSYYDLPNFFDGPLQTGLKERQSNRLVNIMKKMQKNTK